MKTVLRATLGAIAAGGFIATMLEANLIVLKALLTVNVIALDTAMVMLDAIAERIARKHRQDAGQ